MLAGGAYRYPNNGGRDTAPDKLAADIASLLIQHGRAPNCPREISSTFPPPLKTLNPVKITLKHKKAEHKTTA